MHDEEKDNELRVLGKKAHDTYALLSNLYSEYEKVVVKIQKVEHDLTGKMPTLDAQDYLQKLNEKFMKTQQKLDCMNYDKDVVRHDVKVVQKQVEDLINDLLTKQQELAKIVNDLQEIKAYAKHLSDSTLDTLHANMKKQKDELLQVIDDLPIPKETISEKQAAKLIETMVEPIRLDASNSLLTARNHDLRLVIVEKKVENILLQLKNMDLK